LIEWNAAIYGGAEQNWKVLEHYHLRMSTN